MRAIPFPAVLLALGVAACGSSTTEPDVDPRDITYASELEVDFAKMTRTASGLFYQDMITGTGAEAQAGKTVRVIYLGWLPDGTLFDSNTDPGNPLEFPLGVGAVIAGWDEGLVGMRVGGLRKLVIPPALGYGSRGTGPIPGNSVLVFDVGLVGIR